MAAVDGLEPPDAGIKIQCLTIWLNRYVILKFGLKDFHP